MTKRSFHSENLRRKGRYLLVFFCLAAAFAAVTVWNIHTGNIRIPFSRILKILVFQEGNPDEVNIIWKIRLPRILMAAILGGALALSGFLLQTFFENPIAGPFVLGISSGAKMTVALTMVFFAGVHGKITSFRLIFAAFWGSLLITGFLLLTARFVRNMSGLLVAGIMVGYICSAITDFLITFADDSDIVNLQGWSQGSFSGMNWNGVKAAALLTGAMLVLVFLLAKPIGAFQMGEAYAASMGVNVRRFRILLILFSSILSAIVTAYAGPVSFVGIAVPFLIKQVLGTSRPLIVIPAVFLGGGVFCMVCDLIARTAFAPSELRISTVTSLFGAPVVIFMLIYRQREKNNGKGI